MAVVMSFIQTRQGTLCSRQWNDGFYEFDRNYNMIPLGIRGIEGNPFAWCLSFSRGQQYNLDGRTPGIYSISQIKHTAVYHNPRVMQNRTLDNCGR
jgi:hypothetical protein